MSLLPSHDFVSFIKLHLMLRRLGRGGRGGWLGRSGRLGRFGGSAASGGRPALLGGSLGHLRPIQKPGNELIVYDFAFHNLIDEQS